MNRKKLIFLAMIFVLIALLISYFVWNYEPKYAENEITEDLCIEIVRREMEEDMPVQIAGIQKVDDSIIVGYAVGKENQMKTFGFLQFILNENTDKYKIYHNHNDMLETSYLNISVGRFSTDFVGDKLLKPYYIFLSDNSSLKEIDLLEKVNGEYQIQHQLIVGDELFMDVWAMPEAGKYVFLRENNEEWFSRYFVSEIEQFTDDNSNSINMRFDIDYSDIIAGGQVNINCRTTLIETSNPENYYISNVIIRQASRPCTVWFYTKISGIANSLWNSNKLFANLDVYTNTLLSDIELVQDYNEYGKNKQDFFYMGYENLNNENYVRSVQVIMDKKSCLNQQGHFFNTFSKFADYLNIPDEENKLIQSNNVQIEWLIDVRTNSENETKTYTVRQNVPIIIK